MDDEQRKRRAWAGMAEFQRLIGRHAAGPAPLERDEYVASAVPEVASSLINAAVPRDGALLAPHLDDIARFYANVPKWGAWIDPSNREDAEALADRGLVLDSSPVLMAARLDAIDPPQNNVAVGSVSMHELGAVNDLAYDNRPGTITDAIGRFPADEIHAYGIRVDEELASVALLIDVDTDAFVTMVATVPHHRGKHLASNLLRHALTRSRDRELSTTSLQASKLGQGIYTRLGYRPLGEVHLYEKRPA